MGEAFTRFTVRVRLVWMDLRAPVERAVAFVRRHGRIWRTCARLLWQHNVTAMSSALSFRTIFAMIPVLVLAFLVLKSMGAIEDSKQALRRVLQASGFSQIALLQATETAPAEGSEAASREDERLINLADEIEGLVEQVERKLTVGRLGPIGIILLIYTATTLLSSMERSLNRIFGVVRNRSFARSIPLYWSAMTLGPVVVVAGSYVGQRAAGVLEHVSGVSWLLAATGGWFVPLIGYLLLFWGLYKFLPNTDVRWRDALAGALFAVPAWLLVKWGFALYVREVFTTGNLYGALGLVPVFLLWLDLCWLIFLYGAELVYAAGNLASLQSLEKAEWPSVGPGDLLAATLAVAGLYEAGRGPVRLDEIKNTLRLPDESVKWLLAQLGSIGVVCPVAADGPPGYLLARPADKIPVLEVLQILQPSDSLDDGRYNSQIGAMIARFRQQSRSALGTLTVGQLIRADG